MANGQTIIDGIKYLADTCCAGDATKVRVVRSEFRDEYIHLYLDNEELKKFAARDIAAMKSLGFEHSAFNPEEDDDYSYFYFSLVDTFTI